MPDITEPPDTRTTHPWLHLTTFALPTQIEGTSPTGHHVYFRFRWGYAAVQVDDTTVWDGEFGDDMCGFMDETVALRLTAAAYDYWVNPDLAAAAEELTAATKGAADSIAATYDSSPAARAAAKAAVEAFTNGTWPTAPDN